MGIREAAAVMAILFCTPQVVWGGEAFTVDLPELVGPFAYPRDGSGVEVDFDLRREFSEITRVVLVLRAVETPALIWTCSGTAFEEWDEELGEWVERVPTCETSTVSFDLLASLEADTTEQQTLAKVGGFRGYPVEQAGVFQRAFGAYDFDQLSDGQGSLTLWWDQLLSGGGSTITLLDRPTIEILDAALIVEGTPVQAKRKRRRSRPLGRFWWGK